MYYESTTIQLITYDHELHVMGKDGNTYARVDLYFLNTTWKFIQTTHDPDISAARVYDFRGNNLMYLVPACDKDGNGFERYIIMCLFSLIIPWYLLQY